MSMPNAAILLVALLFGCYGWLSGLELGVSWLRLNKAGNLARTGTLFTPLWEITNVFLVFGVTGFVVFFNQIVPVVSAHVTRLLALACILLLTRACLVLYLFYRQRPLGWTIGNLAFMLCSFLIPLSFGAMGTYLLTGQRFYQTSAGLLLVALVAIGLIALAASFVLFINPPRQDRRANALRLITAALVVALGTLGTVFLQRVLRSDAVHLVNGGFVVWSLVMDATLLFVAGVLLAHKEQWLWWWLSALAVASPVLWAWINQPFAAYPITLSAAYGAEAYGAAALIGLAVIFPLIALGLGLFAWLYTHPK